MFLLILACSKGVLLEQGADVLQAKPPLRDLDIVLNGFHTVSGAPGMQEEATHYCARVDEDLHQCVLYDHHTRAGRMIGVEHVVSREVFDALPEEEQRLWHPHSYEVRSGLLIAPGIPAAAEHELMEILVSTYGKTWHVWHPAEHEHPEGVPTLMKSFTEDGQIRPELVRDRDARFGVDTEEIRRRRQDIPDPGFDPIVLEEPVVTLTAPGT